MHTQTQTIQHLLSATESLLSAVRAIADQEKAVMTPVAAPLDLVPSENPVASIEPAPSIGGKRMFTAHQYLRDVYGVTNPKLRRLTYRLSAASRRYSESTGIAPSRDEVGTTLRTADEFERLLSLNKGSIRREVNHAIKSV